MPPIRPFAFKKTRQPPSPQPGRNRGSAGIKAVGIMLIFAAVLSMAYVLYRNSGKKEQSIIFSPKLMLTALWETYKKEYWTADIGRTVDKQRNDITTSEGQSYTMLRAVWQDDKEVFDKTWEWTKDNLKRKEDNLFSWLYGKRPDGSWGILEEQGGYNTATDADTDIAVALVFASVRWTDSNYAQEAKKIISDIWKHEIVYINGVPYVAANNIEQNLNRDLLVNPSYLAPYAYRIFSELNPENDWEAVIDSSYSILEKSSTLAIDKPVSAGLPPDWIMIDRNNGEIKAAYIDNLTTNYSFDAMRTPFRLALDWKWNKEPRAASILEKYYFLEQEWLSKNRILATYTHDGQALYDYETPAIYGGSFGYFLVIRPELAEEIYKHKLESLYSPDTQSWKRPMSYYDDNWTWFALALHNKSLSNLAPVPRGIAPVPASQPAY